MMSYRSRRRIRSSAESILPRPVCNRLHLGRTAFHLRFGIRKNRSRSLSRGRTMDVLSDLRALRCPHPAWSATFQPLIMESSASSHVASGCVSRCCRTSASRSATRSGGASSIVQVSRVRFTEASLARHRAFGKKSGPLRTELTTEPEPEGGGSKNAMSRPHCLFIILVAWVK